MFDEKHYVFDEKHSLFDEKHVLRKTLKEFDVKHGTPPNSLYKNGKF